MRLNAVNLIAAVTLALPMAVHADSFSYRYVDAAHDLYAGRLAAFRTT